MRKFFFLLVVGLLAASSLACSLTDRVLQGRSPAPQQLETPVQVPQIEATAPAAEVEPTASPTAPAAAGDALDPDRGLAGLSSYRMQFLLDIDGQDDTGEPSTGRYEILREVDGASGAERSRYVTIGSALLAPEAPGSITDITVIHDTAYYLTADPTTAETCSSLESAELSALDRGPFNVSDLIGEISGGELIEAGREFNGRPTDVYRYTAENLTGSFSRYPDAAGEYWVDQQLGIVVQITGQASSSQILFGEAERGNLAWSFSVNSIDEPVEIGVPAACAGEQLSEDIPLPPEAADVNRFSGIITFTSPLPPDQLGQFFRTELPAQGWEAGEGSSFPGMLMLVYTREGRQLDILIAAEGEGSSVVITETR